MQIEWIGAGRRDSDNSQSDPSRLINLYRENLNGKTVIKSVPGSRLFASLGGPMLRALAEEGGEIYAAHAGRLSRIDEQGTISTVGDILSSPRTTISGNNGKIVVACAAALFVFDRQGVRTEPTRGAFSQIGSASFFGQRTILTELGGRRIQWSGVADPDSYDGLDFATAEQRDDDIVRGFPINGQFWVFCEKSIEQWYLTGASNFMAYRSGSLIDLGLKSFNLFSAIPNGGVFIGTDDIVYLISGGQLKPVSIRGVETAISEGTPTKVFYYEDEGHKFCVVRFSNRPAWVYDLSMDEWHERAEGAGNDPWSAVDAVKAFDSFFFGTGNSEVRRFALSDYDTDQPLYRTAVSANFRMGGDFFSVDALELMGTVGTPRVAEPTNLSVEGLFGTAIDNNEGGGIYAGVAQRSVRGARVGLRVSRDRGQTFGKRRVRDLGDIGEYDKVVKFRGLGAGRNACFELTYSDPVPMTWETAANVEIS